MLKKSYFRVIEYLALLGGLLVLLMSIITTMDIFSREVIQKGIPGCYELVQYLMVFVVFFPLAFLESKQGNVRVELLFVRYPKWGQRLVNLLSGICALLVFIWLFYTSGIYAWESWLIRETMYGIKDGPLYPWKFAVPLCCFLMCIQILIGLSRTIMQFDRWRN